MNRDSNHSQNISANYSSSPCRSHPATAGTLLPQPRLTATMAAAPRTCSAAVAAHIEA